MLFRSARLDTPVVFNFFPPALRHFVRRSLFGHPDREWAMETLNPIPGRLIRKHIGSNALELHVFYLFLLALLSIPLTIVGLVIIFRHSHPTDFSPSDNRLGFTSSPDFRGTLDIVWSCMSTIFTCVYVSVHVDVPDLMKANEVSQQLLAESRGIRHRFLVVFAAIWRSTAKPLYKRIAWMLFNVFAPEDRKSVV